MIPIIAMYHLQFYLTSVICLHTFKCKNSSIKKKIQFSISREFKSQTPIWPIDRTVSGAINPSQRWPGSDGNEGVRDGGVYHHGVKVNKLVLQYQ